MRVVIVSHGTLTEPDFCRRLVSSAEVIICADGGANHLAGLGLKPDLIIGDMDSIHPDVLGKFETERVHLHKVPQAKDKTDTELALEHALELECDEIVITAALGTRIDHTLANVLLLSKAADLSVRCSIQEAHCAVYFVTHRLELEGNPGDLVSVIPVGVRAGGVTLHGFKYPLANGELRSDTTLGISNELVGKSASLEVEEGRLVVFHLREGVRESL